MKTPPIEEVRQHFKDAEIIKDYYNDILNVEDISEKGIYLFATEYYVNDKNGKDYVLWDEDDGYAEILKYKDKGVKNPLSTHYNLWNNTDAIDVIKSTLSKDEYIGFLKGNILKYKLRDKGQDESDKVKIKDYKNELNQLINK